MQESVNDSLARITRGAGLVLVGILAIKFPFFIYRLMIARHGVKADYGIYYPGSAIFNIGSIFAVL